jgi:hypothetical protein
MSFPTSSSLFGMASGPSAVRVAAVFALALCAVGCSPKIGDHCRLNTDCGSSGTLVCDTTYPNGYCTQFNCTPDVCQNTAACVEIYPSVSGCPYDDYRSPSRTGRTFCLAQCKSNSDCRTSDGYVCDDPRKFPWNAAIIDDVQTQRVCVPGASYAAPPDAGSDAGLPEGSVCSVSGPQLPPLDAAVVLSTPDAADDSAAYGRDDATPDAPPSDAAGDGASASDAPDAD